MLDNQLNLSVVDICTKTENILVFLNDFLMQVLSIVSVDQKKQHPKTRLGVADNHLSAGTILNMILCSIKCKRNPNEDI